MRVLIVEDGDTNRKLIGLVLQRAGMEVAMAENGRIGADLALKNPFNLILMDMQMPVMDGYTATALLRQQGLTIPIIALTAHAMKGDEEKCLAAGCSGYVTKPIDADLLLRTVAEMLARRRSGCERNCATRRPDKSYRPYVRRERGARPGREGRHPFSALPTEDPDFREIVEEFIQRLQDQIAAMQRACDARDLPELARLAHWLKGAGERQVFPRSPSPQSTWSRS